MSNGASNRSFNSDIPLERWLSAFYHEDSEDIEDAVAGYSEGGEADARLERPHSCEHCGRHMKYDDQQCGCTSKMSGVRW